MHFKIIKLNVLILDLDFLTGKYTINKRSAQVVLKHFGGNIF